jgi:hypothetical protein
MPLTGRTGVGKLEHLVLDEELSWLSYSKIE